MNSVAEWNREKKDRAMEINHMNNRKEIENSIQLFQKIEER